jgi:REP element-mobilizing transposase RayT
MGSGVTQRDVSTIRVSGWDQDSTFMWNDTDIPLGYLITFRCYGTWLHGDKRGSIDRFHNQYKSPYLPKSSRRNEVNQKLLKFEPVTLDAKQRENVDSAIREVCEQRKWLLHALNVRTNHIHVVVSIGAVKPERALNAFKAYGTRRLRRNRTWQEKHSPWADRGSKRHLWNERSIAFAIDYVVNGQGGPLPEFD